MQKTIFLKNACAPIDDRLFAKLGYQNISLATAHDAGSIEALERAAFDTVKYDSLLTREKILHLVTKANALLLVARHNGNIGGYAQLLFRKTSAKARFYSLAVHPVCQGSGLGRELFACAEDLSCYIGASHLLLEIRADNDKLKERYGKQGYVVRRSMPEYYPDGTAALRMDKKLAFSEQGD